MDKKENPYLGKIKDGRTDLVFDYVTNSNSAKAKDSNGVALINWCAYYGDVSAIRFLLEKGESCNTLGENFDLNGAVFHGHWQLCQFLIEQGADVSHPLPDTGETPLHSATCKPHRPVYEHIIKILLANGANPNVMTNPSIETGSFMRDCRTKAESPLHRAAAFSTEKSIELLIEAGADLHLKDMNGDTPLSWASWHQRPDSILKILCHSHYSIHPNRNSTSDHGMGWSAMETYLLGKPHL